MLSLYVRLEIHVNLPLFTSIFSIFDITHYSIRFLGEEAHIHAQKSADTWLSDICIFIFQRFIPEAILSEAHNILPENLPVSAAPSVP